MMRADRPQQGVQAIRLASKNKTVHIATHFDSSSGNEIVLWSDVLVVFRGTLYLQHGINVIPLLKGSDFRDLDPPRFACVPGVTLDVVLEDSPTETRTYSPPPRQMPQELMLELSQEIPLRVTNENQTLSASGRNPHGHMEFALANYSHMEAPRSDLRGPQLYPGDNGDNSVSINTKGATLPIDIESANDSPPATASHHFARILFRATQGDSDAQIALGTIYFNGNGDYNQDYQAAMHWYLKAAEQGDPVAQKMVGLMYDYGQGVPVDHTKAAKWYFKSAVQGNAESQHNIAYSYSKGRGVPQDYEKAADWYLRAAEQGNVHAQLSLGYRYHYGQGVPKDYRLAMNWFHKAAEQGEMDSQCSLGFMYENGVGTAKNPTEAKKWFQMAAQQGHAAAKERLQKMEDTNNE